MGIALISEEHCWAFYKGLQVNKTTKTPRETEMPAS
jgi:hypothetical protein